MKSDDFDKLEYNTLRQEIRDTKDRLFKLAAVALIGLPSVSAAAEVLELDVLVVSLPGFIVATMLLYLSESSSVMRCGRYIKGRLEPDGRWEHWLESSKELDHRRVDKLAFWFFMTIFAIYYIAASLIGAGRSFSFGQVWGIMSTIVYSVVGGAFLLILVRHYNIATRTS